MILREGDQQRDFGDIESWELGGSAYITLITSTGASVELDIVDIQQVKDAVMAFEGRVS